MTPAALRNYQRYLLYALVALLPLIFTPNGRDIFRLGKEVFAQILALGIVSLAGAELIQTRETPRLPRVFLIPLAAFCLWSAAAAFWAPVRPLALYALFNLVLFSLLAVCLARLLKPHDIGFLVLLNLVPASFTGIYTLIQYLGKDPLFLTPAGTGLRGRENAAGLVGDVNTAGAYLAISLVLSLNAMFNARSLFRKMLVLAGLGAILIGLLCTQTLTALIATAAACVALTIFNGYLFLFGHRERRKLWIALACLLLIVAAGTSFTLNNTAFRERLQHRYRDLRAGNWAELTSYRAPMFTVTWRMAMERPWKGHGLHSFATDFFAAKLRYLPGELITMPLSIESTPRQTHNEYLQVWAELGTVGLGLLLAVVIGLFLLGFAGLAAHRSLEDRLAVVSALCALVAIATMSLSFFPAHLALTAVWIAIVAAAICALVRPGGVADPPVQPQRSSLRPPARPAAVLPRHARLQSAVVPWTLPAAVLLFALLGAYLLLSPLVANRRVNQATTLIERVMRGDEPNAHVYLQTSLSLLESARSEDPLEPQVYLSSGTAHWFLYQFDEALNDFKRAALLDPTPEVFTNLGEAYRGLGNLQMAQQSFETALAYNPQFEKARNAKALVEQLRKEKAGN
ncbi:MAG: O-antigen ligase family protein [Acidobacteria bacterium]|nr:O-antigen ligase family protein [Acidobacteriota bacterium]